MQQTTVQLIFENWKNLNRLEFEEFMLNQEKTLLREEKEQIMDAYNSCLSKGKDGEFIVNVEDYDSAPRYWALVYGEEKTDLTKLKQSKLF